MTNRRSVKRGTVGKIGSAACILLLVAVMVLSGCSNAKETKNTGTDDQTAAATKSQATETNTNPPESSEEKPAGEGAFQKFDPPITLTTVGQAYGALEYPEGEDMNNNRWLTYLKDNYGIILKSLWEVPGAELEQKTNLMIASGDIPDFFLVTPTQLVQLDKAGLIEDLTDAYANHAPASLKTIVDQAGGEVLDSAKINGRLKALPWTGFQKEQAQGVVWIREDWMKKLNLPEPKTMDDLFTIMDRFTNGDPDGNGQADTIGMPIDKDITAITGFFNSYHAYPSIWIKDKNSGKLAYGSVQPEMKQALAKLQEMYKLKQLDKEFGVKDISKVFESIGQNKLGIYISSMGAGYTVSDLTPGVVWKPFPLPSSDGNKVMIQHPLNINYGYWVVKKGTKHPEAVFQLADAFVKIFYESKDDEFYKQYVSDQVTAYFLQAPVSIYKSFKNTETSIHLRPILESGQPATADQLAALTPEERQTYGFIAKYKEGDQTLSKYDTRNGIGGSGDIVESYIKNDQFLSDSFVTVPTPTMVQKRAILEKMEIETITKIILGASIDEYDKFVDNWFKLGGEQITKEVNDWYAGK